MVQQILEEERVFEETLEGFGERDGERGVSEVGGEEVEGAEEDGDGVAGVVMMRGTRFGEGGFESRVDLV